MAEEASFDFIFESEKIDRENLLQGDLIVRSSELAEAVGEAHGYYAEAPDYSHFLVLTQSCDLVRRSGRCKSRYITICAVRPLSLAVSREFQKYAEPVDDFPLPVGDAANNVLARQFLERVLNNTVDGIFFIPKGSAPTVDEHLCAFLPLSIALRVDHYDALLRAKVAQAAEIFAAKIGSLAGNLYSRVATPDLSERNGKAAVDAYKRSFFEELGYASVAWLSPFQRSELTRALSEAREQGREIGTREALELLQSLRNEADALAERAAAVLAKRNLIPQDEQTLKRARNFLVNDGEFRRLARR